jgi:hypothetical protein
MNIWQIGFVVRSGVSALVVAFLFGLLGSLRTGNVSSGHPHRRLAGCPTHRHVGSHRFFGKNLRKK